MFFFCILGMYSRINEVLRRPLFYLLNNPNSNKFTQGKYHRDILNWVRDIISNSVFCTVCGSENDRFYYIQIGHFRFRILYLLGNYSNQDTNKMSLIQDTI